MYIVRIDRRYAEPLSLAAVIPVKRNTLPCFLDHNEVARGSVVAKKSANHI